MFGLLPPPLHVLGKNKLQRDEDEPQRNLGNIDFENEIKKNKKFFKRSLQKESVGNFIIYLKHYI